MIIAVASGKGGTGEPVLQVVERGGNFRQVHKAGVRLVIMLRPGSEHNFSEGEAND